MDDQDIVVDWDEPDDPLNPKNKKWAATVVASLFAAITQVAANMTAPASTRVAVEFGIKDPWVTALITSIFILAYAQVYFSSGPALAIGSVVQISVYLQQYTPTQITPAVRPSVRNIWKISHPSNCESMVFGMESLLRFCQKHEPDTRLSFSFWSGSGSSSGDLRWYHWRCMEARRTRASYGLIRRFACGGPNVRRRVRCVYRRKVDMEMDAYAPILLERKANDIRKAMDSEKTPTRVVRSKFATEDRKWKNIMYIALTRPFILFCYEPIVGILAIYMGYVSGIYFIFITSMPLIFRGIYGESTGISGLNYIALGIGFACASQINSCASDYLYRVLVQRYGSPGQPEYRLPSLFLGSTILPIGLLVTGWAVQVKAHWIVPEIGITLIGAGVIFNFQPIQMYIIDAFTMYAASALSVCMFARSICGFGFPLFAEVMYKHLGHGKGDTILAAVAIAIGCPSWPVVALEVWQTDKEEE
ncbi:MFS polyamine transporter [Roridomyces roridus]|uniref:MFS polyamine transporter n=1 Tax=Roridomyces roridus TaxID=1738132 RepID=A0AAD7CAA1_9AGAR|nr:MFS polyamine transporter [Roridomyces roridus]